jgi:hypothetical protein
MKLAKRKQTRQARKRLGYRSKQRPTTSRKKQTPPRTAKQYSAKPQRFQDLWDRVVAVISKLRSQNTSLQKTSREIGVSHRTVVKYGGSALQRSKRGRYEAKKRDRLLRMLMIPTPEGPCEIAVRDSRQASLLGEYWNAVRRYLSFGDAIRIKKFDGKFITAEDGQRFALLTNLADLDSIASSGLFRFESIYARTA